MATDFHQLVRDTIEFTGAAPPSVFEESAPVLKDAALADDSADGFYVVGLIGGKEVGKSALVNAMVGQTITASTSFGPGTETVVAYAHESQADALKALLDREAAGQFRIATHQLPHLRRQVLLDLPDIDSHWQSHLELTRRMLRHMLFPVWVQSVEKYADVQPQKMLAQVAAGNSPANFVFCLNKADQLSANADQQAAEELRADYSARIGRTLKIDPPKVWMLSAMQPEAFDLPALRMLLAQQKSTAIVTQSRELAVRQRDSTLIGWLDAQDLPGRLARLTRLQDEAGELVSARIGVPLLEQALPALSNDAANRLALTDEVMNGRCARWPVVNVVHAVLTPVLAVVRRNVGATRTASLPDAEALVDAYLQPGNKPVAVLIRSTFAQIQQTHPQASDLYRQNRLWEDMPSDTAAAGLRQSLSETISRQRDDVRERLLGKRAALTAPIRWLLTIGALIWFPILQPVLEIASQTELIWTPIAIAKLFIPIFGVNYLLKNLTFLSMYFLVLWLVLRWDTQRRIVRYAKKWDRADRPELSLASQTLFWLDELLAPIRSATDRATELNVRTEAAKAKRNAAA